VPTDNAEAWDRYAAEYQASTPLPTNVVHYGADVPTEAELRLCGNVEGKRVLELGCGAAQASVAFAKKGARTTAVDFSAEQLAHAKRLVAQEKVRVELHHGDLADLAFIRADQVDLAFSADALGYVENLDRVFRQVHRVLKQEAPFVFALPHPAYAMIDDQGDPPLLIRRAYYDRTPIEFEQGGITFTRYHHTISSIFTSLTRANFRVDTLLEPEPATGGKRSPQWNEAFLTVPRTLVIRARKQGS
jgi:ubiquinone/menaquinone biosynthesis C-methylase UbiE